MTDTSTSQPRLPFTAQEALTMTDREWNNAITILTASQQVALASDIIDRMQHRSDVLRFRALCKAAAANHGKDEE